MTNIAAITEWHQTADIVIAGCGLAGTSVAIEALDTDPGIDVLILEKLEERHIGGNSRASGQTLFLPHSVEKTVSYQRQLNATNPVPEEHLQAWAEGMVELEPWIRSRAAEAEMQFVTTVDGPEPTHTVTEFPELKDSDVVEYISTIKPEPAGVWEAFRRCLYNRRVRLAFQHRVLDLIQDPDSGETYGVVVAGPDGEHINIQARRGVVLATGGYENDSSMLRSYVGLDNALPLGTPGNTGDGVRMQMRAGAEMRNFVSHSTLPGGVWPAFNVPEQETAFVRQFHWEVWSWLDIGVDNERFIDESIDYRLMHYKVKEHGVWRDTQYTRVGESHMILDDRTRAGQKLVQTNFTWSGVAGDYVWSDDNLKEIESRVIVKADTIEELAVKIGRDPEALRTTVERFNEAARNGEDADYGRMADKMWPIEVGPFYAVKLHQGVICTSGGGVRDGRSRVITSSGEPIPRLYSAGELGSLHANLYQLGAYLTEAMVSGRVAARELLAADPWT